MRMRLLTGSLALALTLACHPNAIAQADVPSDRPIPDIPTLMRQVEDHLQTADQVRKDYIYHARETRQELDRDGHVKKSTASEYDIFWINGVPVEKQTKKDGRDLTPDELKKEDARIDKEVAKAREKKDKAQSQGKETSPRGDDMISASRILELGSFSNPRRVQLDGRDTIVVDYTGNPKAKTRNRFEEVVRDLVGTVWIDEQDKVIRKTEGHFLNDFKIGAGLVANIRKDSSFGMDQIKVNDEVWLPSYLEGKGAIRFLLLAGFDGRVQLTMSDYRKFHTTSTILPGVSAVEEDSSPSTSTPPAPPPTPPQ
jgi:hypothetical protein